MVPELLGTLVAGTWRLQRILGRGGMSTVFAAEGPDGVEVALKLLHPELSGQVEGEERLLREAVAAGRIEHSGAVAVLDSGTSPQGSFLILELLKGETCGAWVRREGPRSPLEVLEVMSQVLSVLVVAHARQVIHRDLKPENLFRLTDGRLKVLDFGLALLLDSANQGYRTRTGLTLGTVPYMAPEQALGRRAEIDGRTDLFSLGATAFRLLTGRHVHEGGNPAEILARMAIQPAPLVASVRADLPACVCALVDHCLAHAQRNRPASAEILLAAVEAAQLELHRTPTLRHPSPTWLDTDEPAPCAEPPKRQQDPTLLDASPLTTPNVDPSPLERTMLIAPALGAPALSALTDHDPATSPAATAHPSKVPWRWFAAVALLTLLFVLAMAARRHRQLEEDERTEPRLLLPPHPAASIEFELHPELPVAPTTQPPHRPVRPFDGSPLRPVGVPPRATRAPAAAHTR